MLPSETMIWQPEFTDKTLSRKPGAVHKENGFNHVKTFTKIIFIFSVLVFNDNEYKITDAAVNLFIQI